MEKYIKYIFRMLKNLFYPYEAKPLLKFKNKNLYNTPLSLKYSGNKKKIYSINI